MPVELADSYESIYQRALVQMVAGKIDEAIESMLRIVNRLRRLRPETLERKPDLQGTFLAAREGVIQFLRWEKRYDQAIAVCESVLDRLPDPDGGKRRIASLMIEKGEVEEGLARLRQMVEETPSFASWIDLGAEYVALQRYDQAEPCYKSALSLAGSNQEAAIANSGLLHVYQEIDHVEKALSAWNMAVVLDPNLADQGYQVYDWLIEREDLDKARRYLERERAPIRRTFYDGMLDWHAGEQDAARQKWRDVLEMPVDVQDPGIDAEVWMEAVLRLDEPEEVVDLEEKLLAENTAFSSGMAALIGIAHAVLGEIDDAQKWFDRAIVRLQRAWPSRDKIPADKWPLFTSLVSDEETLQGVAAYFDESKV